MNEYGRLFCVFSWTLVVSLLVWTALAQMAGAVWDGTVGAVLP